MSTINLYHSSGIRGYGYAWTDYRTGVCGQLLPLWRCCRLKRSFGSVLDNS